MRITRFWIAFVALPFVFLSGCVPFAAKPAPLSFDLEGKPLEVSTIQNYAINAHLSDKLFVP